MKLDRNSQNGEQCRLFSEEDDRIRNWDINDDSVENRTNRSIESKTKKMIVYLVLVLSVVCIGFVLLFAVPYHLSNMKSINTSIDPLVGSSSKFHIIPGNDGQEPIGSTEMTDADINMTDCHTLDEVLLSERQARLDALKIRQLTQEQKTFWSRIHAAWNVIDLSMVPMDIHILDFMIVLSMMKHIVIEATPKLREEGYELLHDLFLEEQQSQNQSDASIDWLCALGNFTDNIESTPYGPELALEAFDPLAEGFHLYYQKIEIKNSQDDSNKMTFGGFVYRGVNPEKLYVRNVRHILNAIVRLYFKIHNPSVMRAICGDADLETEPKKAGNLLFNYIEESMDHSTNSYGPQPAFRRRRSLILKPDSMEDPNLITSKRFQSSMEMFFDKMEILSSHIDRLHERYMKLNELNDDYISREFSVETDFEQDAKI